MKGVSNADYLIARTSFEFRRPKDFNTLRKNVSNWFDVMLFVAGIKESVIIKLRNGKTIRADKENKNFWTSDNWLALGISDLPGALKVGEDYLYVEYHGKRLRFSKGSNQERMMNSLGVLNEQFVEEAYRDLNVENRVVLDIGANIGDTVVYFAIRGAKQVIALEPYPYLYETAKHNISLNKLDKKVVLLNNACGDEGQIPLTTQPSSDIGGRMHESKDGKRIKILTLKSIVDTYELKHAAMKMDCEGHEYAIFGSADAETLQAFDEIIIEYHLGYQSIEKKLKECGFNVHHTRPTYIVDKGSGDRWFMGFIFASKKALNA
jgi:FkbM family methyltransferase